MSNSVCVVRGLADIFHQPREVEVIDLEDDACAYLEHWTDGLLTRAIRPVGLDSIFNGVQVGKLLEELRSGARHAESADVAANIAAVASFIEDHLPGPSIENEYNAYVVFLAD